MAKQNTSRIPKKGAVKGSIPLASPVAEFSGISFSFKYLDVAVEKFRIDLDRSSGYFCCLIGRLRDLSTLKMVELKTNRSGALRFHPIDFADTTEPNGFPVKNAELWQETAFEFLLSVNEHGRVHGFTLDEVFYIVWLDPDHSLYD